MGKWGPQSLRQEPSENNAIVETRLGDEQLAVIVHVLAGIWVTAGRSGADGGVRGSEVKGSFGRGERRGKAGVGVVELVCVFFLSFDVTF